MYSHEMTLRENSEARIRMENQNSSKNTHSWLDRPVISSYPQIKLEHLLVALIILAAVISRFYNVGLRVMSHDEVNHVVPSYDLYIGRGYSHDPVTHGPLQFHLLAASYFLFGDTDFTSRIPAALFSVATVIFVLFGFRRYLGRTGALLAGVFFLISPYMLFYGRYTRNEAFVGLFTVVLLYAVLRYLEKGKTATLYLYTITLSLYFCTKETSFIFAAEMLIFLALIFIKDITQKQWKVPSQRDLFILVTIFALLLIGIALGTGVMDAKSAATAPDPTPDGIMTFGTPVNVLGLVSTISVALAAVALVAAVVLLITGLGWSNIRKIRSFDLLILNITLVMPQLIAFPISLLGWNPLDYSQPGLIRTSIVLLITVILAVAIGMFWKPALWLKNAAIFYAIFTIFYTTMFTNGQGFFTGMVGSLGYWLSQQSVNRGTQPWFYYAALQIPMYEYLAAFGSFLALIIGISRGLFSSQPGIAPFEQRESTRTIETGGNTAPVKNEPSDESVLPIEPTVEEDPQRVPILTLLLYWSVLSLIAYSVAGEKMPWLTVHITLPMLLASGYSVGYLLDSLPGGGWNGKTWIAWLLTPVFLISLSKTLNLVFGTDKPFAGMELYQLQTTSTFLFSILAAGLSGWGILKLLAGWQPRNIVKGVLVTFFAILAILTARSAFQANYINYDTGKEFLVYAHSARGPKDVLEIVEDISKRTTGGKEIKVAYIGDALYPYWWYFRDYPNKGWFKENLTRDLAQYTVVISDDVELVKTRAILKDEYYEFKYKRLVWPMQDYMSLTIKSLWDGIRDPQMRQAIHDIWLNKDYTLYSQLKGISTLTVENWEPSGNIYMFIKKDLVASIWNYGVLPTTNTTANLDPYADRLTMLTPDLFFGTEGPGEGQFLNPHGIAIARNGEIYVADSHNHRIQHFSAEGEFINTWGAYGSVDAGNAEPGFFNEPWGIAVGPDGSVYVADTWNYRIQKFDSQGKFIAMWGTSGASDAPTTFWGPRGVVVGEDGKVFITDTGNNRVVIFDEDGNYLSQFGINGINPGEFDEPVGLAIDAQGNLYVADTWNQRVQVFTPNIDGLTYQPLREWNVNAWEGQSVNNKPFIAIDPSGNVFVTDPDAYRVLQLDVLGNFIRGWGDYSSGIDGFGMPIGIAVDNLGRVWVSDSDNNYVLRFTLPVEDTSVPQGLPALPASKTRLEYNLSTGLVENPLGESVYRLDPGGLYWVPIVPEGTSLLVPEGSTPVRLESGEWVLFNAENDVAFRWQPDLLLWLSEKPTDARPIQN